MPAVNFSLTLNPQRGRSAFTQQKLLDFQQLLLKEHHLSPRQQAELTQRLTQSIELLEPDALTLGLNDFYQEYLQKPDAAEETLAAETERAAFFPETAAHELFQRLTPATQQHTHGTILFATLQKEADVRLGLSAKLTDCFILLLRDAYLFGKETMQAFVHSGQYPLFLQRMQEHSVQPAEGHFILTPAQPF